MKPRDFLADDQISPLGGNYSGRDFLMEDQRPKESLEISAALAIPRIGEDILKSGMGFINKIPEYYEKSKTEIPGLYDVIRNNPMHALGQTGAGLAEMGQNIFNTPHNIINYAANRLNLIPENINRKVQMARMPEDTSQLINQQFGEPKYPGESLIRGTFRNLPEIAGITEAVNFINPLKYTAKNISKNILKTEGKQIEKHNTLYNKLWSDAEKKGFEEVPVNTNELTNNLDVISKYKTPREYQSLENFINDQSLSNAQKAQSDMGIIKRSMEKKSRSGSLTSEERSIYEAAKNAENHIEDNMFKDKSGRINQALKNRYDSITKSYRENVIPYKYNSNIQAYKNRELLPIELKQRLSRGKFAAQKGREHPELFRGEQIKKALLGLGIGGGILGGGKSIYDYLNK